MRNFAKSGFRSGYYSHGAAVSAGQLDLVCVLVAEADPVVGPAVLRLHVAAARPAREEDQDTQRLADLRHPAQRPRLENIWCSGKIFARAVFTCGCLPARMSIQLCTLLPPRSRSPTVTVLTLSTENGWKLQRGDMT